MAELLGRLSRFRVGSNYQKPNSDAQITGTLSVDRGLTTAGVVVPARATTQTKTANYTMTEADIGKITYCATDGVVFTLPATVVGYSYTFVNNADDGVSGMAISPNASDKIMGNGYTSADDKDAINTKATSKKGDRITLIGDGVNGWMVTSVVGTWNREA